MASARQEVAACRLLVAISAFCLMLASPVTAHAQAPAPTTVAGARNAFPYRIVISGPVTTVTDTPIAYTLDYRWVAASAADEGAGIVLGSDFSTLVSVTPVSGAAPTDLGPQTQFTENYGLDGEAGRLRVVVQPSPGFTGLFGFGFYVRGTEIGYPAGTVNGSTTLVAPPGAMIITGEVPAAVGEHVSVEALNVATQQPVTCDSMTSRPFEVPGPLPATQAEVPGATPTQEPASTYFGLIVAPSCMQSPSVDLRICWSPDLPPSPPPAVDTRPCSARLTFHEGLRTLGLVSATAAGASPNAAGPASRISGPVTGGGTSAGAGRAPLAVALAVASLAGAALAGGLLLRRDR